MRGWGQRQTRPRAATSAEAVDTSVDTFGACNRAETSRNVPANAREHPPAKLVCGRSDDRIVLSRARRSIIGHGCPISATISARVNLPSDLDRR